MANCTTLQSMLNSCAGNNSGGIFEAYIIDQDDVVSTTLNTSAHTITAISASTTYTTVQFKRNVGNAVTTPTIDLNNGSTYYSSTITITLHRREAAKSYSLQILGEGQRYLNMIIKDANDRYWMYSYAQLNGGAEDSGTARADGSKYAPTFLSDMENRPYEVDSSIIAGLI